MNTPTPEGTMREEPKDALFNVIARRLDNGATRLIAEGKTEANAEAIMMMAVRRRGVEEECFDVVRATGRSE